MEHKDKLKSTEDQVLYDQLIEFGRQCGIIKSLNSAETSDFFPQDDELKTTLTLYCDKIERMRQLYKASWLLGSDVQIITPHVLISELVIDIGESGGYSFYDYGGKFFEWLEQVKRWDHFRCPRLLPSLFIRLHHDYDFDSNDVNNKYVLIEKSNLEGPLLLPDIINELEIGIEQAVEIPLVLIDDTKLLQKVCADYPIASAEFNKILRDSYRVVTRETIGDNQRLIYERIMDEVVQPGVTRIRAEYKELFKSTVVRGVAQVVGVSVPLAFSAWAVGDYPKLVAQLLSAGLGLKLANSVVELRDNLVKIRKTPFWAAMKMDYF